ncbi:GNAT family N-acetyltransferase [Oceanobacillus arenosus]|uniref:GNAT family N-acetyltransferase n=1 Tax=Oceanobacillus arenosus TaxID=1229153 RepID=A0A3D8PPQ1_9BACI|nr:GNAT family N-acetyltransferase [Oceanobacillus arenosus]RDW18110.1 GNAT family N-acetyltransferase [Oceanobacillus arenosus]
MNNLSFYQATEDNIPELLDLTLRAYAPIRDLGIHFAAATANEELVRKNINENICFYMMDGDKIVATASVRMPWGNHHGPYEVPHIWWVAVDPEYKNNGYASKLLDYVEKDFLTEVLHCPSVSLGTAKEHPWLANMYLRRGYQVVGETDLGKGHTTVYFEKLLLGKNYKQR